MIRKLLLAGLALAPPLQPVRAQDSAELHACMDRAGGVSTEMLACGKAEIDRWDKRLNDAYRALMRTGDRAEQARLRREQRAWLKRHRAETHRLAAQPDNGSAAFLVSQSFELSDLAARALALEKRFGQAPRAAPPSSGHGANGEAR